MTDGELVVLGPRRTFLTRLFTVENLYRRTHTISCLAAVGDNVNPSWNRIRAIAGRAFTVRIKVFEKSEDGVESPYDLTGMTLKARFQEEYNYTAEEDDIPDVVSVSAYAEVPASAGMLYFNVSADSFEESGDFIVEIVDDRGVSGLSSICRFQLNLASW